MNVGSLNEQYKVELDIQYSTKIEFDFIFFVFPGLYYDNNSKKFCNSASLNHLLLHDSLCNTLICS